MTDFPSESSSKAQRRSIEDEALLMNRGRGRHLFGMIAGAVVVAVIGVAAVQTLGRTDAYDIAAAETARIRRDHFDGFFGCALVGSRSTALSAARVQTAFAGLGEKLGKSYQHTLQSCESRMNTLATSVRALQVPDEAARRHEVLIAAADALVAANAEYLRYLSKDGPAYGDASVMPILERFGAAWAGYDDADTRLRLKLQRQL